MANGNKTVIALPGLTTGNLEPDDELPIWDTSQGVMKRVAASAFGLKFVGLDETAVPNTLADLDAKDTPSGLYRTTSSTANSATSRPPNTTAFGFILVERYDADKLRQTFCDVTTGAVWHRARSASGWRKWRYVYDSLSLFGTVSVDGDGDPTGAGVERGSNSNGNYVRLADGTQMCWMTTTTSATSNTSQNFPAAFVDTSYVMTITPNPGSAARRSVEARHNNPSACIYNVLDETGSRVAEEARVFAIGHWR
jgi:hypothetical protein